MPSCTFGKSDWTVSRGEPGQGCNSRDVLISSKEFDRSGNRSIVHCPKIEDFSSFCFFSFGSTSMMVTTIPKICFEKFADF